ncbi:ADP-ribosylation factor-like protein 2-binding protein [Liolophura sinensis]|uniref:ADP-ribosylation factor-like protein 2-binding protein n=1 Tax=Liolophura sinensis TaxID=3198878 RepID=UPI00315814E9
MSTLGLVYYVEPMELMEAIPDEDFATSCSSDVDTTFDMTIGHIEDIIMDEEFQAMQTDFMEKYYQNFVDTEENKFIYTDIQKEYTQLIERRLEQELLQRIPGFNMAEFTRQLITRKNELEGEIFEILLTFTDFMAFKEMFLDYKAEKEGRVVDFSDGILVTPLAKDSASDLVLDSAPLSLSGHPFISQ